jgi:hypothetical protein
MPPSQAVWLKGLIQATEPSDIEDFQLWINPTTGAMKLRNASDNSFIDLSAAAPALASVDTPPTVPHADNDEFDSATLNPAWTEVLEGTPPISIHGALPSHYLMKASGADKSAILTKAVTVAGDETWVIKFRASPTVNFAKTQIGLFTANLADGMYVDWIFNTALNVRLVSLDATVVTVRQQVTTGLILFNTMYLYLKRASNVWSFAHSYDGASWFEPVGTHSKTFTIAKMEIKLDNDAQTIPQRMAIDYVRRGAFVL